MFIRILLILALAATVRFLNLGDAALWLDELLTVKIAQMPWDVLWITAYDPSPPLFYTIERLMLNLGHGEFLLRLPSAIFGTLTVGVVYAIGQSLAGPRAAVPAALLIALSWSNVEYSQEARAYALVSLCVSLSALGLIQLSRAANDTAQLSLPSFLRRGGMLYAVSLLAALYSHNTAVFFWLAANAYFVLHWSTLGGKSLRLASFWIITNALVLLSWLPWFAATIDISSSGMFNWLQQADAAKAARTFIAVHGFRYGAPLELPLFMVLLVLGLFGLVHMYKNSSHWALLLFALLASSLGVWLYGFVSTPVYMARTILWGTVFSSVLVGIGIAALPRALYWLSFGFIIVVSALGMVHYSQSNAAENENWGSAASTLQNYARTADILLFCQAHQADPLANAVLGQATTWQVFAMRKNTLLTTTFSSFNPWRNRWLEWKETGADVPAALGTELSVADSKQLWLVDSHCEEDGSDVASRAMLKSAGWRHEEAFQFRGITLERYLRP